MRVGRLVVLASLVGVAIGSGGCAAALVDRSADAGAAGRASASVASSDRAIEEAVRRRLAAEPGTKSIPVLVECRGGVVTLRGLVKSPAEHAAPERIARGVRGVASVRNELRVR